jgi:hypothetical protein
VIGCPDAILKKDVDACGGCVIVSPPAGAVAGMDRCDAVGVVEFVFAFPLPFAAVFVVPALLPGLELPFVGFALEAVFVFGGWFALDMAAAADEEEEENAERDDSDDGKATPRPPACRGRCPRVRTSPDLIPKSGTRAEHPSPLRAASCPPHDLQ